jgi:dienelactone hydrolase
MIMADEFAHLGPFSDLVGVAAGFAERSGARRRGLDSLTVRQLLGFDHDREPTDARVEAGWSHDGVDGEEVSWWVGYGPRTRARFLRPSGATAPLPGVLALHGHDAYKFHGLEKIADGPSGMTPGLEPLRREMYEGRAFANDLARRGFAVLAPDAFLWGSRRFDVEVMPAAASPSPEDRWIAAESVGDARDMRWYNRLAARHEHVIAKYCALLGTSLAGIVAYEDRIAAHYLASRTEVRQGALGCVGLSGGGCRAALLQATSERIGAAVIVGMMTTHSALLDRHLANHTWMFVPPNLAAKGDWPDLAASRAPSPLMVQYLLDDALFPVAGMRAAHRLLTERYEQAGAAEAYIGEFYPGPHRFDMQMQDSAFSRLALWLP